MWMSSRPNGEIDYFVSRTNDGTLTLDEVREWQNARYTSFDEFANDHWKIYMVTCPARLADWKDATCTCQEFDDDYMCKHVISIAVWGSGKTSQELR